VRQLLRLPCSAGRSKHSFTGYVAVIAMVPLSILGKESPELISYPLSIVSLFPYVDHVLLKPRHFSVTQDHLQGMYRTQAKLQFTKPGADIDSDHNLLVAKIGTRLKRIIRFQKKKPRWDLEELQAQGQKVQESLE
jgi:hypothetical protein